MKRTTVILLALLVLGWSTASAGWCSVRDDCWQVGIQTAVSGEVTTLTFTVTPLCKDVSYVTFGFPASATVTAPANGSTYIGPLTGYSFAVSLPAGGQVSGNAIKFQPPGATWQQGTAERFVVTVEDLLPTDTVHFYGHAGGGPLPVDLPTTSACGPNAVTLANLQADGTVSPVVAVLGFILAFVVGCALGILIGERKPK